MSAAWRSAVEAWQDTSLLHPGQPAVEDGSVRWTHGELRLRAHAWASKITGLEAAAENIALHFPLGAEAIAAWLGVLLAGRAFIALDPSQSVSQRIAQLNAVDATVVLARGEDAAGLRATDWNGTVVTLPETAPEAFARPAPPMPGSRACIYFTSGSSGKPKAVAWSHRTVTRAAGNLHAMFSFAAGDCHALLSPLANAATAAQILAPLMAGGTLCLFEARRHSISQLSTWLQESAITTLQTVPALFRALGREAGGRKPWPALRAIKLGGEGSTVDDARLFETFAAGGAVLINGLGLTEAGFNVCWCKWQPGQSLSGSFFPIGIPSPDLELVLESSPGIAAPAGEAGEIVVRSPDLADGYWKEDSLNARIYRDIPDRPGWRELRSRDAGRWRADGMLEYLGRLDDMVKIRGHGVDPVEVEFLLGKIPAVHEVAVIPRRNGETVELEAFAQPGPGTEIDAAVIREQAGALMPDYMIPARIHLVTELPRTGNGKVDRQLLKAPDTGETAVDSATDVMTLEPLERTLHGLFCRALRRKKINRTDSFFDLGGDSLSAAILFSAITKTLQVELPLAELTQHPSVESLAARIRSHGWNPTDNPVILLTPSPSVESVNLFAWPGAGSDVMPLADLARHLGPGVSFYAIQHRGADGRRVYDLSMAAMADRGVELVRRIQPRGPYALCGTSFGGHVAMEVARRLRASGETVCFLALIDTYATGYPSPLPDLGIKKRFELFLRAIRPLGHKDERGFAVLKHGLHEQIQRLLARRGLRSPDPKAPLIANITIRFLHLQEACFTARENYDPEPYDGSVHLFSVEIPPPTHLFILDEKLGWGDTFTGPFHLIRIPGRHGQHLREPHVRTLAAKLGEALAQAYPAAPGQTQSHENWDAAALWNRLAPWWDEQIGDEGSAMFRDVALGAMDQLTTIGKDRRALDIACGNGWFARRLARAGAQVVAIDISSGMLEAARTRSAGLSIDYCLLDATSAEAMATLERESFDLAVCNMGLQDLSSIEALFPGVFSAVRPGGLFVISMVHPSGTQRADTPLNRAMQQVAMPGQPLPHIEIMRPLAGLSQAATKAGWELEKLLELPSPSNPMVAILSLRRRS